MSGYQGFAPARHHPSKTPPGSPLEDLAGYVAELVDPIKHDAIHDVYDQVGKRRRTRHHKTVQPSLLDQLRAQVPPSSSAGTDPDAASSTGAYESRPPVNSEALGCLMRVERQAEAWVREVDIRPRVTVEANLRALVGAAPTMDATRLGMLVGQVRSWHTSARIVCDWQAPAWHPHVPCPACGRRNGLQVRLAEKTAMCVLCRAVWDPGTIGILADHIRAERATSG